MSAALCLPPDPEPLVEAAAFLLTLRGRGISDLGVLRAMESVPRELFAPRRYADLARQDVALPLACGETMSAPGTVALMLAALDVRPGQRVLEVGTGSGYVTALLARMGASVVSIERRPILAESARHRLASVGLAGACRVLGGDAFTEWEVPRTDRILLNGAIPALSAELTSRLGIGGRLVCGHAGEGGIRILAVSREADGRLATRTGSPVRLSRLMVNEPRPPATEA